MFTDLVDRTVDAYAVEVQLHRSYTDPHVTIRPPDHGRGEVDGRWRNWVERCVAAGIDPVMFIRHRFACTPTDIAVPLPQRFFRVGDLMDEFESDAIELRSRLNLLLQNQLQHTQRYVLLNDRGEGANSTLRHLSVDFDVPLDPVFRLALAFRSRLVRRWTDDDSLIMGAVLRYGRMPAIFDEAWGERWVHPRLSRLGPAAYDRRLGVREVMQ